MLSVWYLQAPSEAGVRLHSAEELESGFGHRIRHLGQEHPTGYLLCQALRRLEPPVLVSDAIARRWLRVHCGINVRSKIDNAADLERDWGSRIREQLALPSYSEATTAGQLFWSRGGPGCIPSLRLKHTSTPARVQHPLRTRGQQPLHEALHTSIGRVFVTTRAMVLRVERQGADSRSPALYLISIDILKPHVLVF